MWTDDRPPPTHISGGCWMAESQEIPSMITRSAHSHSLFVLSDDQGVELSPIQQTASSFRGVKLHYHQPNNFTIIKSHSIRWNTWVTINTVVFRFTPQRPSSSFCKRSRYWRHTMYSHLQQRSLDYLSESFRVVITCIWEYFGLHANDALYFGNFASESC